MKFTDDSPKILMDIRPTAKSAGPVALSCHSKFGFNVRHFYQDWKTGEWHATQKGIAIFPADAVSLLNEMAAFINEVGILEGSTVKVVVERNEM